MFLFETFKNEFVVFIQKWNEFEFHHDVEEDDLQDLVVGLAFRGVQKAAVEFAPLLQPLDALHDHFVIVNDFGDNQILEFVRVVTEVDDVDLEALDAVEEVEAGHFG